MQRIVIDWGSSSFRAYLVDCNGQMVCARTQDCGVLNCGDDFKSILLQHCDDWLQRWPETPIVLCGMIGSRNGWREAPYLQCPANAPALGGRLLPLEEMPQALIVPGLQCISPGGASDVMRGEETQVFGALHIANCASGLIILPGTHSKWVRVEDSRIENFATFLTGELFALLRQHSSIGTALVGAHSDQNSFLEGVKHSQSVGGVLHQIFSARAKSLCEDTENQSLSAYLSGVLIGSEFSEALTLFTPPSELLLVSDKKLQPLYQLAAQYFGVTLRAIDPALAVLRGVEAICKHTQILTQQPDRVLG